MDERGTGWEKRLAGATRAYVELAALYRAPADVVADVTTRPVARPRRAFAVVAVAVILAVTGGLAIAQLVFDHGWPTGAPTPTASPLHPAQVWPAEPLPPPYDWDGVREALAPRGPVLELPTAAERSRATVAVDEALMTVVEAFQPSDGRANAVSVHLAAVTYRSERLGRDLLRELMYVIETTGHRTGNCFTLLPATPVEAPTIGACFYPNRSAPP